MSFRNNEDWDLCWDNLSCTGCTNSNCSWRHQNSADGFYQKYLHQTPDNGMSYRGDAQKTPGAPFDRIKQHQDGGVEDQHGLSHYYPDMDKKDGFKKSIQFQN